MSTDWGINPQKEEDGDSTLLNQSLVETGTTDRDRLKQTLLLIAAVWFAGLVGHFTPLKEWGALAIYLVGSIALALWRGGRFGEWRQLFITHYGLKQSLLWGGIIGTVLFLMSLFNIEQMKTAEIAQMQTDAMADLLIDYKSLLFLPLLIVAEEFLWRGLLLSSLLARGFDNGTAIAIATLCFILNHFAVAPVELMERLMMALMGLPLGVINGYLTIKTQNLWGGVLVHFITMLAMLLATILM